MEKYSGKDYQPRPNQNKGAKKQEAWVEMVRTIQRTKANISDSVNKILSTISQHDNIPRKKASFVRFLQNSFRYMKMNDIEAAWGLLEEEMKKQKPPQQQPVKATNGAAATNDVVSTSGAVTTNGVKHTGKRKRHEDDTNEETTDGKPPVSKKRKEDEDGQIAEVQHFNWTQTIKDIILSKNNHLKMKKLKKKVFNRYKAYYDVTCLSDKFEKKFSKNLKKLGVEVQDGDTVRLIE